MLIRDQLNILWLDDQEMTVELPMAYARSAAHVELYATPHEIIFDLEAELGKPIRSIAVEHFRIAWVVDIMLVGVDDLLSIGIRESDTFGGANAGFVFVDRYLRDTASPFFGAPVCILTERESDTDLQRDFDRLRERGGGRLELLRKYDEHDYRRFCDFIDGLWAKWAT